MDFPSWLLDVGSGIRIFFDKSVLLTLPQKLQIPLRKLFHKLFFKEMKASFRREMAFKGINEYYF